MLLLLRLLLLLMLVLLVLPPPALPPPVLLERIMLPLLEIDARAFARSDRSCRTTASLAASAAADASRRPDAARRADGSATPAREDSTVDVCASLTNGPRVDSIRLSAKWTEPRGVHSESEGDSWREANMCC
jgi:hypothetical protein